MSFINIFPGGRTMIRAIVYVSNTGFTKKYAELFSAQTGLPCYPLSENRVKSGEPVIFMGWLSAGKIKGYAKALKKYDVKAVAGVGLRNQDSTALEELVRQNNITGIPAFYLRGGLDMDRLRGYNKFLLKMFYRVIRKRARKGDPEAASVAETYEKSRDYVSLDNLKEMLDWYRSVYGQ